MIASIPHPAATWQVQWFRNLWRGCEQRLAALNNASQACLKLEQVPSLAAMEDQHGPYDDVIVAAGAAAAVLPEVGRSMLMSHHPDRWPVQNCL